MDLKGFKTLLKEYNTGSRILPSHEKEKAESFAYREELAAFTRDCSYYENYEKEMCDANGID